MAPQVPTWDKAMIEEATKQSIIGHISRDSTAIHAREKPTPKCKSDQKPMKHKRGRPWKDEVCGKARDIDPPRGISASKFDSPIWLLKLLLLVQRRKGNQG